MPVHSWQTGACTSVMSYPIPYHQSPAPLSFHFKSSSPLRSAFRGSNNLCLDGIWLALCKLLGSDKSLPTPPCAFGWHDFEIGEEAFKITFPHSTVCFLHLFLPAFSSLHHCIHSECSLPKNYWKINLSLSFACLISIQARV